MIPCRICGRDASTGRVRGFAPAPDSQKIALCPEHDTAANREAMEREWRQLLEKETALALSLAGHKAAPRVYAVTVRFTGGGTLSFTCLSCAPTLQDTLRIEEPDGSLTFIPLRHIRDYTVRTHIFREEDAP
ncbi:MAG: hypothetical protein LBR82_05470 [Desulfovibrio sp.]|jgi:hypothetical protein|nr:hypothetical protein [Desulfovibrio sp.]